MTIWKPVSLTRRVVACQWLGPWVLRHALQAAVQEHQQRRQRQRADAQEAGAGAWQEGEEGERELIVHLVCCPGGGAPSLQPAELRRLFDPGRSGGGGSGGGGGGRGAAAEGPGAAPGGVSCTTDSSSAAAAAVPEALDQRAAAGGGCSGSAGGAAQPAQQQPRAPGLLLLIPLTLGVGKVRHRGLPTNSGDRAVANDLSAPPFSFAWHPCMFTSPPLTPPALTPPPRQVHELYLGQLRSVLAFPQSVGVVGGRPGASLYFVGAQGAGGAQGPGSVVFLDPHEVKEVRRHRGGQLHTCVCVSFAEGSSSQCAVGVDWPARGPSATSAAHPHRLCRPATPPA